jgi:hypothetical protein
MPGRPDSWRFFMGEFLRRFKPFAKLLGGVLGVTVFVNSKEVFDCLYDWVTLGGTPSLGLEKGGTRTVHWVGFVAFLALAALFIWPFLCVIWTRLRPMRYLPSDIVYAEYGPADSPHGWKNMTRNGSKLSAKVEYLFSLPGPVAVNHVTLAMDDPANGHHKRLKLRLSSGICLAIEESQPLSFAKAWKCPSVHAPENYF